MTEPIYEYENGNFHVEIFSDGTKVRNGKGDYVEYPESIDLKIFNRYGTLLFETTDPDITWNATDQKTQNLVSSGTYYYTLVVNTIRLQGIIPVFREGYIQILNATQATPQQ
jgi:gliding motility-associated-like protein